jgi:heptosyltransferase I
LKAEESILPLFHVKLRQKISNEPFPLKILIVKTSSMGDVVHSMPAISDIAANVAGAQIDWLVEAPFAALPAMHPAIRTVIPIAWRKWRKRLFSADTRAALAAARAQLQAEKYDLIIDLQGLAKSALWATQARGPRAGYNWASAREPLATLLYSRRATIAVNLHAVTRSRQLVAAHLDYAVEGPNRFGLHAPDAGWMPQTARYAVLITGASRPEKLWPEALWQAVAATLTAQGYALVWLWGSPEEGERARRLAAAAGGEVPPFLTVKDATAMLALASLCVGLDTGFTHIAAAFAVPTVGIYCDHEPGLVGITGEGYVASVGGRRTLPSVAGVLDLIMPTITN